MQPGSDCTALDRASPAQVTFDAPAVALHAADHATIDTDDTARYVGGLRAREEGRHGGELTGLAVASGGE